MKRLRNVIRDYVVSLVASTALWPLSLYTVYNRIALYNPVIVACWFQLQSYCALNIVSQLLLQC